MLSVHPCVFAASLMSVSIQSRSALGRLAPESASKGAPVDALAGALLGALSGSLLEVLPTV